MRLPLLIHLSNPAAALRAGSAPSFRELRLTPGSHPGRQRGRTRENPWKVRFRPARPVPEGLALSVVTEAAGPAVPCGLRDPRRRGFAHLPGQRSSDMLRERSARQAPLRLSPSTLRPGAEQVRRRPAEGEALANSQMRELCTRSLLTHSFVGRRQNLDGVKVLQDNLCAITDRSPSGRDQSSALGTQALKKR